MIREEFVSEVAALLRKAAKARSTVSYNQLYAIFGKTPSQLDVFDTLEAAGNLLADLEVAIYTSVLAKNATGLPGDGFYDAFRNLRYSEWEAIAGEGMSIVPSLTIGQRRKMVDAERTRVYLHASAQR